MVTSGTSCFTACCMAVRNSGWSSAIIIFCASCIDSLISEPVMFSRQRLFFYCAPMMLAGVQKSKKLPREIIPGQFPYTPTLTYGSDADPPGFPPRSEEHTSELQSRENLVCRLLLEKKKNSNYVVSLA